MKVRARSSAMMRPVASVLGLLSGVFSIGATARSPVRCRRDYLLAIARASTNGAFHLAPRRERPGKEAVWHSADGTIGSAVCSPICDAARHGRFSRHLTCERL